MSAIDRPREVKLLPEPAEQTGPHLASRERPELIHPATRARAPEAPRPAPAPDGAELALPDLGALLAAPRAAEGQVIIDEARADAVPIDAYYAGVIGACLERIALLGRQRHEQPLGARPRTEARLLAQLDAMAEASVRPADLLDLWENEGQDSPWMSWATCFALGALDGPDGLLAVEHLLEALPEGAATEAFLAAEALIVAPHPGLRALAVDLLASPAPLARSAGIELGSRRFTFATDALHRALADRHPAVLAAAIRAGARLDILDAKAIAALRTLLDHPSNEVAGEAARALTLTGHREVYLEILERGPRAAQLGTGALEVLVMVGTLDDLSAMQPLVRALPASAHTLSAVARFGHAGTWAYLLHHLGDDGLAGSAQRALSTLFGPIVPTDEQGDPAAWRAAIVERRPSSNQRYRSGEPWSLAGVCADCQSGRLPRREIERRLDELRARTGTVAPVDLSRWGADATLGLTGALASLARAGLRR